jgi:hypothetical protein
MRVCWVPNVQRTSCAGALDLSPASVPAAVRDRQRQTVWALTTDAWGSPAPSRGSLTPAGQPAAAGTRARCIHTHRRHHIERFRSVVLFFSASSESEGICGCGGASKATEPRWRGGHDTRAQPLSRRADGVAAMGGGSSGAPLDSLQRARRQPCRPFLTEVAWGLAQQAIHCYWLLAKSTINQCARVSLRA